MAIETVTSETLEAFNAARMPVLPQTFEELEQVKDAPKEDKVESADAEEEQEDKPKDDKPKRKPGIEGRFSELTAKNRQATEAREAAERRAEAAEAKAKELEAKLNPAKQEEKGKPNPAEYTDAYEYAEALAEWKVDEKLAARDKKTAAENAEKEEKRVLGEFHKRVEAAKADIPDYDEVLSSAEDLGVNDYVKTAIIESDVGPYILHHLALNPDLVDKLNEMKVPRQLREIGKLESNLEASMKKEADDTKEAKEERVKRDPPPAPINPIKRGMASENPVTADGEFKGTFAQWKQARQAGKI